MPILTQRLMRCRRGFSNQWVAAFTTVSAFSGTGITMTSDSLAQYWKAPAVYLFLCTTMLAGHDVVPVLLRGLLQLAQKYGRVFGLDRDGTWYALDHPRQVSALSALSPRPLLLLARILILILILILVSDPEISPDDGGSVAVVVVVMVVVVAVLTMVEVKVVWRWRWRW
eukprot:1630133-Rhodomonas_salina.2